MKIKYRILYVEDDQTIAFLTQESLESFYEIVHCDNGLDALNWFQSQQFDLCIFDIMIPKLDGFELTQEIRKINIEIPIIFISAKTLKEDRIKGLKFGADDYLIKPFSIEELILKIEIFLKRTQKSVIQNPTTFTIGQYKFDAINYTISNETEKIKLTQRESELLKFFIVNKNTVLKREEILKALWGDDDYFMGRSLDVFISRLRKIFYNDSTISIENLHGIGFIFKNI